ncbi:YraN family protein [Rhodococcus sp. G-MC3]|uniref:YraN family protein n=1 Tax=Rhodococcus sp. G-MC3 TaxID=3046209 RepID=UPI0024BB7AA0|nr:YraN family protein [Rhodococcus sp. G-MC3]MDJ0391919.1 YraN family protein [Rhodococcus sp. G-MC3]
MSNSELGARGEALAALQLVDSGMEVVDRNWRCRYGELDIVARDGDVVVFVEVKTRSGTGYGTPAESVTYAKQQRIRRLALAWLDERGSPWVRLRFDVIGVLMTRDGDPVVSHLRGAF